MLIAIAADLHDNLANWKIFNHYAKKQDIKNLLFCGDLGNQESLKAISNDFNGKIYLISGNADLYQVETIKLFSNINFLGRWSSIIIDNIKMALIHEPENRKKLEKEIDIKQIEYIFYGHTHKPWLDKEKNLLLINPGTLGGVFYPASFAILDTKSKKVELKRLDQLI